MRILGGIFWAFLAAASVGGFVRPLWAGIIAADDFESYSTGQLEPGSGSAPYGGSGWTSVWDVPNSDRSRVQIVERTMFYSAGNVYVHGGNQALQLLPGDDELSKLLLGRKFPSQTSTVYISFLLEAPTVLQSTGGNTTNDFLQIGMDTSFTNPRISGGIEDVSPQFFARVTTDHSQDSLGSNVNDMTTYLVVLKFSENFTRSDIYLNPTTTNEGDHTPTATKTLSTTLSSVTDLIFRTARHEDGKDWYFVDQVTIGTQFSDVVTAVPEPTALGLICSGTLAAGALFFRRRKTVKA